MLADGARGQGRADAVGGERLAGRVQGLGPGFQRPVGQGDVGGDDDVAGTGPLGDPVVGHVRPGVDHG